MFLAGARVTSELHLAHVAHRSVLVHPDSECPSSPPSRRRWGRPWTVSPPSGDSNPCRHFESRQTRPSPRAGVPACWRMRSCSRRGCPVPPCDDGRRGLEIDGAGVARWRRGSTTGCVSEPLACLGHPGWAELRDQAA
jgi:hypothetical protein